SDPFFLLTPFFSYSTELGGQWLSWDPIQDPDWNLYRYVLNNPINAVDPSGLEDQTRTVQAQEQSWGDWLWSWFDWGRTTTGPLAPTGTSEAAGALEVAPEVIRLADLEKAKRRYLEAARRCPPNEEEIDRLLREWERLKALHGKRFNQ
ncbi:MAG: hypothetical protein KF708_19970, partial [Pirellulales bacterium]|nr:hypothetical protein [Pirellulales bacterium]